VRQWPVGRARAEGAPDPTTAAATPQRVWADGTVQFAVAIPCDLGPGSYPVHLANASASDFLSNPKAVAVEDGTASV
jgi:hypothetical protein